MTPEQERDALAGELALGLLDAEDRAFALRLSLSDPSFAALVAAWEFRLAPLHREWKACAPGDAVWRGIEARLPIVPRSSSVTAIETRLRRWRAGAVVSGAVAAALAVLLLIPPTPPALQQLAVARIESAQAGPVILARYNRTSGVMQMQIDGFEAGALVPELWVIPSGADPVSLGQIQSSGRAEVTMASEHRTLLQDGATLAITMEPASPTPHRAPSSAPVAVGKIIAI